jgi:hypothetical protein
MATEAGTIGASIAGDVPERARGQSRRPGLVDLGAATGALDRNRARARGSAI